MTKKLAELFEQMTAEEQAEIETFALFLITRRKLHRQKLLTDDISIQELMHLVESAGSFDWLASEAEDVYSLKDGDTVKWPKKS